MSIIRSCVCVTAFHQALSKNKKLQFIIREGGETQREGEREREKGRERVMLGIPDCWKGGEKTNAKLLPEMIKDTSVFYREQPAKLLQKIRGDKAAKEMVIRARSWWSFLKNSHYMKKSSLVSKKKRVPRADITKEHIDDQCPMLHSIRQSR